jgi:hypothetical protein
LSIVSDSEGKAYDLAIIFCQIFDIINILLLDISVQKGLERVLKGWKVLFYQFLASGDLIHCHR